MNHPLQCRCGKLQGYISNPKQAIPGVCYCRYCQAYAHFLGETGDVLDEMGGTQIVAILPKNLTFTRGLDTLVCVSLTQRGPLRWYASCCNTPIGNTLRSFKLPFVSLVHTCLQDSSRSLDSSFGPIRMWVHTKSAKGTPETKPISTIAAVFRFTGSLIGARLDGSYKHTPFFDTTKGNPIAQPKVLNNSERTRVMNAV